MKEFLLRPIQPWFSHFARRVYFPMVQRYKGEQLEKNLLYLKDMEHLPWEILQEKQWLHLQNLLDHARKIPFWAERLQEIPSKFSPEDFRRIPILSKEELRRHNSLLSANNTSTLEEGTTSGSTGIAVRVKLSPEHQSWNFAYQWLGRSWYDIKLGDPGVWIWGRPVSSSIKRTLTTLKARLNNLLLLQIFDLSESSLAKWWEEIKHFRPVYFYGYASALDHLAAYIEENRFQVNFPVKLVSTTAEILHDFQRQRIARVFGAPVANEYGSTESGSIAFECPVGGWHLCTEHTFIEFLDAEGHPVAPGELGDVIVTPLRNTAMPLLRYRLGDMGSTSKEVCACGRPWPLMSIGVGKSVEMIQTTSGKRLSGAIFHYINRSLLDENIPGIQAFRVRQKTLDHFTVEYVPESQNSSQNSRAIEFFSSQMKRLIGNSISVEFLPVSAIEPEASGKLRYFISEVETSR